MIVLVIWTVLMLFWLFYGGYANYDPAKPHLMAGTLIPWLCVLLLGLVIFGALDPPPKSTNSTVIVR